MNSRITTGTTADGTPYVDEEYHHSNHELHAAIARTPVSLSADERDALLMLLHLPRPEDCGLTERERELLDAVMTRLHETAL